MLALPILAVSHPTTIVGGIELNFCVRAGNRWTLDPINTNCMSSGRPENITIILLFFHLSSSIFQIHSTARNPTKWLQAEAMSSGMIEHSSSFGCERYAACEELVTRTGFEPMLMA